MEKGGLIIACIRHLKGGASQAHRSLRLRTKNKKKILLKEAALSNPEIAKHLKKEEIDEILDPLKYTGLAAQEVDRVIAATLRFRETDEP